LRSYDIAIELSGTISKNQKRRYKRAQEVPAAFFIYLKKLKIVKSSIPEKGEDRIISALTEFLHDTNYPDMKARDAGEYLRKCLLKDEIPMLRKSFGDSSSIWKGGC